MSLCFARKFLWLSAACASPLNAPIGHKPLPLPNQSVPTYSHPICHSKSTGTIPRPRLRNPPSSNKSNPIPWPKPFIHSLAECPFKMASNRLQLILSNSCSAQQLHVPGSPKGTSKTAAKAPKQSSKVAPKLSPRALQRAISFVSFEDKTKESNNNTAATKQPKEKGNKKMRQVEVIMEDQQLGEQRVNLGRK